MTGTVELDRDGAHLLIRFPYREDLVAEVKELPGRRWDPKAKTWRVPATHAEQVYARLCRHMFEFAPEIMSLIAGTLRPAEPKAAARPARAVEAPPATHDAPTAGEPAAAEALSVSALNARVRDALRGQFPQALWVVGEILDYDKSAGREHRFFKLVEKARGQAQPRAAVEVALFARTAARLLPRLEAGAEPLQLRDGIEVRLLVQVDLYAATGRFQVVVEDIDPSFTLGKLALTREQILRELRDAGLADRNRSLGVPIPPLRIGVLTSPDSDGWSDFRRHLEEARAGVELTLVPVHVQGAQLKPDLLAGLHWFAQRAADFDVLCILRGGGSRTDLAWFDDRDVALAVARHPLKILVGIGHQRDQSVLDAIAHSEKTPTAVAAFLARCVDEARTSVREQAIRLQRAVAGRLLLARTTLARGADGLRHAFAARIARERTWLAVAARALRTGALGELAGARAALGRAGRDLHATALLRLQRAGARLAAHAAAVRVGAERRCERARARLDQQAARQRLLDPARVLGRGFALVQRADGGVVTDAARLADGQIVQIRFRDGRARARTEAVQLDARPPRTEDQRP